MFISFAIPFYNKASFVSSCLESIATLCEHNRIKWEAVITDNCSSSEETLRLKEILHELGVQDKCKIYTLAATISAHENWLYAITLCSGDVINLRMADDPILNFDLKSLCEAFYDTRIDYVSTNSRPTFDPDTEISSLSKDIIKYYDNAQAFKEAFSKNCSHSFIKLLDGDNPFGDINSLFFRRKCVELLREPIDFSNPPFLSWPDLEIWLKITLSFNGLYLDINTSSFSYNKSGAAERAKIDSRFRAMAYELPSDISRLLIYHPSYKSLLDRLSERHKAQKAISMINLLASKSNLPPWKLFLAYVKDFYSARLRAFLQKALQNILLSFHK